MNKDINRKSIFMTRLKSKVSYVFNIKDLEEIESIIDFYEKELQQKDEVIEEAINKVLIKENTNLKQALNEIREYIENNSHSYSMDDGSTGFVIEEEKEELFCKDILQKNR